MHKISWESQKSNKKSTYITRIDHSTVDTFFNALPRVQPYPFPSTSPTVLQATTHCTFLPKLPFLSSQKLIGQKVQHIESKKFHGYVEFLTALIKFNFIKDLLLLGLVSSFHFSTKIFKAIIDSQFLSQKWQPLLLLSDPERFGPPLLQTNLTRIAENLLRPTGGYPFSGGPRNRITWTPRPLPPAPQVRQRKFRVLRIWNPKRAETGPDSLVGALLKKRRSSWGRRWWRTLRSTM